MSSAKRYSVIILAIVVLVCASGLVSIDMCKIIPTSLSPQISQHSWIIIPISIISLACTPFAFHFTGVISYQNYKIWQPFRGGNPFIIAQGTGWFFVTCFLIIMVIEMYITSFVWPCLLQCMPGVLIAFSLISIVGNGFLLLSLFLFDDKRIKSTAREYYLIFLVPFVFSFVMCTLWNGPTPHNIRHLLTLNASNPYTTPTNNWLRQAFVGLLFLLLVLGPIVKIILIKSRTSSIAIDKNQLLEPR